MNKRLVAILIAAGVLLNTTSTTVFATPNKSEAQQSIQLKEKDKEKIIKEISDAQTELYKFNDKIEGPMSEIDTTNAQIKDSEDKISQTKEDLTKAEAEAADQKVNFGKRVRALYVNGVDSYIEVLLSSNGVYDFITKVDNLRTITKYDKKTMDQLKEKEDEIASKKATLEDEQKQIVTAKAEKESKLQELQVSKNEHSEKLNALNVEKDKYVNEIAELQDVVAKADAEVVQANNTVDRPSRGDSDNNPARPSEPSKPAPTPAPQPSTGSASGQAIVSYAYNFLGCPYVWGATGPSTFDCSGLTSYVYRQFGYSIGRTTYDQINAGVSVSKGNLQPGDLVFFGSPSAPHHVGIFVGGNQYLHAPTTGDVVKISSFTAYDQFSAARRIIK